MFDVTNIAAVALGVALSACCGFRVFVPMLAGSLASFFNWYHFAPQMEWLGTLPALITFATASVLEIGAYYIPFVDNLLDTIAAPLSVAAGTVLASSILPIDENMTRWIAALFTGGVAAGTLNLGTGLLRLFSSKFTAGTGNVVVASTENAAAVGGSALSLLAPVIAAVVLGLLVVWVIIKMTARLKKAVSRRTPENIDPHV